MEGNIVLSAQSPFATVGFSGNCNNLSQGFVYYFEGGSNAPTNYCWIITLTCLSDAGQLAWARDGAWVRRRSGGSWSNWLSL